MTNSQPPREDSSRPTGVAYGWHCGVDMAARPDSSQKNFTLTDAEREAIRKAMVIMRIHEDDDEDVLEALLERTK